MHVLSGFARLKRALSAPLPLVGLLAAAGPLALSAGSSAEPTDPGEIAYRSLEALPAGSEDASIEGVVATAIELARTLHAVPVDAEGTPCPAEDLVVSWEEPGAGYSQGAYVSPVGPTPTASTTDVNGVVLCDGVAFAFMGFEASFTDGRWDVVAVPDVSDETEEHLTVQPAPAIPQGPKPVPVLAAPGTVSGPIEGYAAYEPQRTCDPTAKVGMRSLAGALLRDYEGSRNLGIVRGCSVGGRSEHKEGRAFDWGVNITNPNEAAAASSFITSLLATDSAGNKHALARRMGIMYVIWNRQIWSSYRASEGWRPYTGASPHRDHVHISMSWAGGLGRTSFWSGTVPPDLPTASPNTSTVAAWRSTRGTSTSGATAPAASRWREHEHRDDVRIGRDELRAGVQELWQDGTPPTEDEIRAWLTARGVAEDRAAEYAGWAARRIEHDTSRSDAHDWRDDDHDDGNHDDEHDDDHDGADEEARRQAWAEERERREAEWRAERERQQAERAAHEEAEREAREAREEAEREARAEREETEREAREEREEAERERHEEWEAERQRRQEEWDRRKEEWHRQREAERTTTTVATPAPDPGSEPPAS